MSSDSVMKPGISVALTSSFRRIMSLRPLSICWLKVWDCPTAFLTTLNRLKYKASSSSGMNGLDCTVTRSCIAVPFAHSLYVLVTFSKSFANVASLASWICFVAVESSIMLQNHGLVGSVANIAVIVECCAIVEYLVHQSRIQNKFCWNCLFVTRQH